MLPGSGTRSPLVAEQLEWLSPPAPRIKLVILEVLNHCMAGIKAVGVVDKQKIWQQSFLLCGYYYHWPGSGLAPYILDRPWPFLQK